MIKLALRITLLVALIIGAPTLYAQKQELTAEEKARIAEQRKVVEELEEQLEAVEYAYSMITSGVDSVKMDQLIFIVRLKVLWKIQLYTLIHLVHINYQHRTISLIIRYKGTLYLLFHRL